MEQNPLPVCIVSNIDRNDILRAIKHHGMNFENVVTSEDAKSYKPQPEIFLMALDKMGVQPSQVLHIGDSLSSDVAGAYNLGIDSFWLNRKRKNVPHNCPATFIGISLTDVIEALK